MKTVAVLLLLMSGPLFLMAQDYHPLIEDDKTWLEAYHVGSNICSYESVYQMRFGDDTLIEGNVYRKVLRRGFNPTSPGPYCPPFVADDFETEKSHVFVREDTATRQGFVWAFTEEFPEGHDVMLYDFSLEPGDTIPISYYTTHNTVITVDTVMDVNLLNGETRKAWFFDHFAKYYVEGIGGAFGLLNGYMTAICCYHQLHCVQQNGVSLFPPVGYGSDLYCSWIVSSTAEMPQPAILVYPNPGVGQITFDIEFTSYGYSDLQLTLFNLAGQQILATPLRDGKNDFTINEGSGMYLWRLSNNNEIVRTGKLVVQ